MSEVSRQIYLHGPSGDSALKEVLGALLAGLIMFPDELWLVSPWVSDFVLLDNRSGDWDSVEPAWGARYVYFAEMLALAVESGCTLHMVTNLDEMNRLFHERLTAHLSDSRDLTWRKEETLHTKGLLGSTFFLAGSMNFTYSGAYRNDEHVQLSIDRDMIMEARLEFESRYASL